MWHQPLQGRACLAITSVRHRSTSLTNLKTKQQFYCCVLLLMHCCHPTRRIQVVPPRANRSDAALAKPSARYTQHKVIVADCFTPQERGRPLAKSESRLWTHLPAWQVGCGGQQQYSTTPPCMALQHSTTKHAFFSQATIQSSSMEI